MKAKFVAEPMTHVLLEDFYPKEYIPSILNDFKSLDKNNILVGPEISGGAKYADGSHKKKNRAVFLPAIGSTVQKLTCDPLFKMDFFNQIDCEWWKMAWGKQKNFHFLMSRYDDGDKYDMHYDRSFFTLLVWLYDEPKPFTGGDLIFNDFDVTIECKNNTGVIFLGPWHHEVTEVKGHGRYTLTMFTSNGSDKNSPRV